MFQIKNLSFGYTKPLLESPINAEFQPSQLIVLYGNNGCGKTTFIKTIARLIKPLSGEIYFNNQDVFKMNNEHFAKTFAFLFTNRPFLMNHTVMDVLALGRLPYLEWNAQLKTKDIDIILYYANFLKIEEWLTLHANQLSDGQLQKVLLAKTLIQQTPVVILDEPLSYLDYGTKKFILSKLSELIKMENKIIIMSSHDVHICSNYANAVLLMHNKKWLYTTADKVSEQKLFSDFLMTEV